MFSRKRTEAEDRKMADASDDLGIPMKPARPAAPALVQLTRNRDKEIRNYALDCLLAIKPEKEVFTPALVTLLHDPDKNISYRAAESLLGLDADAAEKAGVFTLFPQFK